MIVQENIVSIEKSLFLSYKGVTPMWDPSVGPKPMWEGNFFRRHINIFLLMSILKAQVKE